MPHPNERIGPNIPMREIPRAAPRLPEVISVAEPLPGFPGGARRVMTEQRPMRPSQVAKCMASK